MSLPLVHTNDRLINQLQQNVKQALDPVTDNPLVLGIILKDIVLTSGSNTINHKLGRTLQGWIIVRQQGPATFYDTQTSNLTPNLTLLLTSSANVTVNIYVF